MKQASVFTTNKSQAVRLPKDVAFPEGVKKVDIIPLGQARLMVPAGSAWDSWFESEGVSDDFMSERDQPADQQRDQF
jgi:antitoxin VapB